MLTSKYSSKSKIIILIFSSITLTTSLTTHAEIINGMETGRADSQIQACREATFGAHESVTFHSQLEGTAYNISQKKVHACECGQTNRSVYPWECFVEWAVVRHDIDHDKKFGFE